MPNARAGGGDDMQFDQRLFNQSKGMDSGYAGGEDESYNVYDQPWRQDRDIASSIYRPSKNIDKDVYGDDLDQLMKKNRYVHLVVSFWEKSYWEKWAWFGMLINMHISLAVSLLPGGCFHLDFSETCAHFLRDFSSFIGFVPLILLFRLRFAPDKEFAGTDRNARREGPVQFARDEEEDPFGLDRFLDAAKKGAQKRPAEESSSRSRDHDRKKRRDWWLGSFYCHPYPRT